MLDAAVAAFSRRGIHLASMKDIAEVAALVGAAEALSDWGLDHPEETPDTLATRLMDLVWTGLARRSTSRFVILGGGNVAAYVGATANPPPPPVGLVGCALRGRRLEEWAVVHVVAGGR